MRTIHKRWKSRFRSRRWRYEYARPRITASFAVLNSLRRPGRYPFASVKTLLWRRWAATPRLPRVTGQSPLIARLLLVFLGIGQQLSHALGICIGHRLHLVVLALGARRPIPAQVALAVAGAEQATRATHLEAARGGLVRLNLRHCFITSPGLAAKYEQASARDEAF